MESTASLSHYSDYLQHHYFLQLEDCDPSYDTMGEPSVALSQASHHTSQHRSHQNQLITMFASQDKQYQMIVQLGEGTTSKVYNALED